MVAALGFLKLVPRWVWWLLAAALLYRFGLDWHQRQVDAVFKRGEDAAYARVKDRAEQVERDALKLTIKIKERFDAVRNDVDAAARSELQLGPGKAAYSCPPATLSGGHRPPATAADDGGHLLPEDNRNAMVPWGWLVSRAQQCDLDRAEVMATRQQHRELVQVSPASPSASRP